jgi:AGCS family alanine or glycine:cation symporter
MTDFLSQLNSIVWGVPMLVLLFGTGIYLNIRLQGLSLRRIGYAFGLLLKSGKTGEEGDIAPFKALMTSMSATVGTGNIAGVATAIGIGGPGALFWMWVTALIGLATKYSETVLAVNFREKDDRGNICGGPMYFIKNGMGPNWKWLATAYAMFASVAAFGIGNTVQSNSVADALHASFRVPEVVTAIVLAVLVAAVLLGGIKRISNVAAALVPTMAILYFLSAIIIIAANITQVPAAFELVVTSAFTETAATGGFAGAAVWVAIRMGVARGIFSNEAGLGSGSIAHAAAQTNSPVRQGFFSMVGTFTDTLIICSLTGFVILLTGSWTGEAQGAAMTAEAFSTVLPMGSQIVAVALVLFAFTTVLGWSYYGEKSVEYLFGSKSIFPFRVLWVLALPIGATVQLDLIWLIADTLNALMALPNLIALIALSPVVVKLTREYIKSNDIRQL